MKRRTYQAALFGIGVAIGYLLGVGRVTRQFADRIVAIERRCP